MINIHIEKLLKKVSLDDAEIIIVDGNQTSTPDIIVSNKVIKISSKKGRANQMNAGVEIAKGEVLLFLHADTILPKNALDDISNTLKDDIVAGAFDLQLDSKKFSLKIISTIASYRSRMTRTPYGDQAIFIKKAIFEKVGGYEDMSLMEDVNLMQKLKKQNYKIKILNSKVITSARKWEQSGVLYTTLRNWILICLYYLGIDPNRLSKFYH